MNVVDNLSFSISACTRQPRANEQDGKDYYFFTEERFKELMAEEAFLEWEMVYEGKYYGTLRSERDRIWNTGETPLFDIDVQGAVNLQQQFEDNSLSIFIQPPSIQELQRRLESRGTETDESVAERVSKAVSEQEFASKFDTVIINDDLEEATEKLIHIVKDFLSE